LADRLCGELVEIGHGPHPSPSPRRIVDLTARSIINYSFEGEGSNVSGNAVREALEAAHFEKLSTASYHTEGRTEDELVDALTDVLGIIREPPGGGRVDHLWVYRDGTTAPDSN
jgi:hypothetical protein